MAASDFWDDLGGYNSLTRFEWPSLIKSKMCIKRISEHSRKNFPVLVKKSRPRMGLYSWEEWQKKFKNLGRFQLQTQKFSVTSTARQSNISFPSFIHEFRNTRFQSIFTSYIKLLNRNFTNRRKRNERFQQESQLWNELLYYLLLTDRLQSKNPCF